MNGDPNTAAGWYRDPSGAHQLRYYSTTWTDHVSDGGVVTTSAPTQPASAVIAPAAPSPPGGWGAAGQAAHTDYGVAAPGVVGSATVTAAKTRGPVLVLIGGVLMALGPLFPWETASASSVYATTTADAKGTSEGAGPVVLIAGLIVTLLSILVFTGTTGRRKAGIATLLISAVSLVFVVGNYSAISKDVDSAPKGVDAAIGIGLIVAAVGCTMAAIASIGLLRKRS
jgi:hypothetical protein